MLTETKYGWLVALTILIGAGATAAGIELQIMEFLKGRHVEADSWQVDDILRELR